MSYGYGRNRVFIISMFGDVRLRLGYITTQLKKLDPKTISGFFVGYYIGSRGFRFYCPSHTTRIIESNKVVYFEDEVNVDPNFVPREIHFGEEHVVIPFPTSHVPNVDIPIV